MEIDWGNIAMSLGPSVLALAFGFGYLKRRLEDVEGRVEKLDETNERLATIETHLEHIIKRLDN